LKKILPALSRSSPPILGALGLVAGITYFYFRVLTVNNVTVALTFLLAVLTAAAGWGLTEALVASVAAVFCFNYFFLPPAGTLSIADPQNWAALLAFVVTAVVASHLSSSARKQARESARRRTEMERLYTLSRNLLLDGHGPLAQQIANAAAQAFELEGVAFFDRSQGGIYRAGPHDVPIGDNLMRDAAVQGTVFHDGRAKTTVVPITLGGRPLGSLGIQGDSVSETTLHSLANLAAITLERARVQEIANRAEASRQSGELKSTLLDALAHEFKTPLTPIKAAVTSMLADNCSSPTHRELLSIVNEETERLNKMLTDSIQMSRIEAGDLQLNRSPSSLFALVWRQIERLADDLQGREVIVDVPEDLPLVSADPEFIGIVIWQMLNNALRYTPPHSAITLRGRDEGASIVLSLEDTGSGIPEAEQQEIFEKFYRGKQVRERIPGSGMGLAIAREIVQAHGGRIWVESEPGKGARFLFSIPCVPREQRV